MKIGLDKVTHALACFGLTLAFGVLMPVWLSAVLSMVVGVAKEVWDGRYGSGFDKDDLWADAAGVALALLWLGFWHAVV